LRPALIRRYASPDTDEQTVLAVAHANSGSREQLARWWDHPTNHITADRSCGRVDLQEQRPRFIPGTAAQIRCQRLADIHRDGHSILQQ
jgi:hypothetical protein